MARTPTQPPKYAQEVTGSRRVAGIYRAEVRTTRVPVTALQVYFPAATELSRQQDARTIVELAAERVDEPGREHRPILRIRFPIAQAAAPHTFAMAVRYEATLLVRRLVAVQAG
jgi:hypothetical protein